MLRIVVLVSGGGTNLQAIFDGIRNHSITNAEVVGVISNNQNAYALERANNENVKAICISPKQFEDRKQFHASLLEQINSLEPDLIVLAGFLVNIDASMIEKYPNKIINIHPSLIPSFCGQGYYGLKVHEYALKRGVKVSGATVHFVDNGTDTGPIIMQKAVSVKPDDTAKSLQQRIMEEAEWVILPKSIDAIANGRVTIQDSIVKVDEEGK